MCDQRCIVAIAVGFHDRERFYLCARYGLDRAQIVYQPRCRNLYPTLHSDYYRRYAGVLSRKAKGATEVAPLLTWNFA